MKKCSRCGQELPTEEFYRNKRSADGLQWYCKKCAKTYSLRYYAAMMGDENLHAHHLRMRKKRMILRAEQSPITEKRCAVCGQTKSVYHFYRNAYSNDGFASYCKECKREYDKVHFGRK